MNENKRSELVVSHEWLLLRIVIGMVLVMGLVAGVIAVLTFRNVQSKAAKPNLAPILPMVEIVPPAQIQSPYARLVAPQNTYSFSSVVPVSVYLNTNNLPTSVLNLVIPYDPEIFEITEDAITVLDLYKSGDVEVGAGIVTIYVFINPELGHTPVTTEKDVKIAQLLFKTKTLAIKDSPISLDFDQNTTNKTSLIEYGKERSDTPINLLNAVEGITLTVTP